GPTQRGSQCRVVDRDDPAVVRRRLVAEDYLLVLVFADQVEDLHPVLLESAAPLPPPRDPAHRATSLAAHARPHAPCGRHFTPGTAPARSAGAAPGSARRGSRWSWRHA